MHPYRPFAARSLAAEVLTLVLALLPSPHWFVTAAVVAAVARVASARRRHAATARLATVVAAVAASRLATAVVAAVIVAASHRLAHHAARAFAPAGLIRVSPCVAFSCLLYATFSPALQLICCLAVAIVVTTASFVIFVSVTMSSAVAALRQPLPQQCFEPLSFLCPTVPCPAMSMSFLILATGACTFFTLPPACVRHAPCGPSPNS